MQIKKKKKIIFCSLIIIAIVLLDRFTKLYVLSLVEIQNHVDIFVTSFLNIYLVWNKGIAFGLLNFEQKGVYSMITAIIAMISMAVLIMIVKTKDIRVYFLSFIFAGAIGNLFDRLYYTAVPDFIDLHVNNFHWFIFNVADIFISFGVICLILVELIFDKYLVNENK